jgi:hypothetical protein
LPIAASIKVSRKDLIADHLSDLGGLATTTISEQALVRRAAMLILQCEMLEAKWAANDGQASEKSLIVYQRTASALRRILQTLGLKRGSRDVTPSLDVYLAQHHQKNDAKCASASLFDQARMPKLLANILFRCRITEMSRARGEFSF